MLYLRCKNNVYRDNSNILMFSKNRIYQILEYKQEATYFAFKVKTNQGRITWITSQGHFFEFELFLDGLVDNGIKSIVAYATPDGLLFDSSEKAKEHLTNLFNDYGNKNN